MESTDVVAGTNGTAEQYNKLRKDYVLGNKIIGVETDGATVTFDMSLTTKSNIRTVTLGGDRTLALSNVSIGQVFIIQLKQDSTGGRTVTWFETITWSGGSAPSLTTTGDKTDVFGFICTDTGKYQGYILGMNF